MRFAPSFVLVAFVGTLTLTLFFQNCSKVGLEQVHLSEITAVPTLDLKSHVCSQARFTDGEASKFVFIVDLSASNFGGWSKQMVGNVAVHYWDPALATDAQAARFEAIKFFLTNCGNQKGAQFAVIGFSRAAGVLKNGTFSCDAVAFGPKEQIQPHIDALQARQAQDEAWYRRWMSPNYLTEAQPDSLIYSVTSYTSASKCAERLIIDDLTLNAANAVQNYHIFFISDGLPEDKKGTGCNLTTYSDAEKTNCYLRENLSSVAMTRTAAISKGKNLRIQGIYYGNAGGNVPIVLNALSQEGGTSQVVTLDTFSKNQTALCDLTVSKNGFSYQPDIFMTLNMTARREKGQLVADSDLDGIADEREVSLGYDPQNPRSSGVDGVLDGICERVGGPSACQAKRATLNCSPQSFDKLGLTDCDAKMLGLDRIPGVIDPGVDADRDGLPDFVEVVKGTDPGKSDLTLDPDADGVTTRDEILAGLDPFFPDRGTPAELLNASRMYFEEVSPARSCEHGNWALAMERLQTIKTRPVSSFPDNLSDLRHTTGEQILLVLHRLTPTNSTNPTIEYYGRYVRIKATGPIGAETLQALPNQILPEDFLFLGKAQP